MILLEHSVHVNTFIQHERPNSAVHALTNIQHWQIPKKNQSLRSEKRCSPHLLHSMLIKKIQ